MKILICGAGGIGSWLIEEICLCIEQGQIDAFTEITLADNDMVELSQVKYQNFPLEDAGKNKAKALASRFSDYGIKASSKRIEKISQLKGFDIIVLCVDNQKARDLVIRYCHKNHKEFIDLRATGRTMFAMPKLKKLADNLKFVDAKDTKEYSCQEQADLDKGFIQKGNKVVAQLGNQMLLNLLRGHGNRMFSLSI